MVAALTFGSLSRAKSTRAAGSTASTSSARGISSRVEAPSRSSARRASKSIHAKRVAAPGRSSGGRKMRSFMARPCDALIPRAAPDYSGRGVVAALHQRIGCELDLVLCHLHAHAEESALHVEVLVDRIWSGFLRHLRDLGARAE